MKSGFYYEGHHQVVALAVRDYVNSSRDFLSPHTAGSPRAVGDALEAFVAEKFGGFLGDWCTQYSSEFLDWSCLTVGALGWGQIQIANSNNIRVIEQYSRKQWMLQLCDAMLEFYPKEIGKIEDRIERFNGVRKYWEAKEDLWH